MSSGSGQRSFQLKLNPLTGNSEWVVIDEDDQVSEFSQQPILATTSYLDMLNDSCRNRAFREAIDQTIAKPCHVLDIGAGTGLLSMMAARAMERAESTASSSIQGVVTACESYLPMVKLMRKVLHVNGMGKNINLFNKRSDELKVGVDIPTRADVLVSEILDSELLGEGLIPSLQHAHDNLLVENPKTVPYRAITYGQLVESTFLRKLHDISNNEANVLDLIHLVPPGLDTVLRVKSQQHAMHCDPMTDQMKLLSEPFKIFEFDFWKRPSSHGETQLHIKATNDGRVHAIISWWILQLDCEGTIFYSTAPRWISLPFNTGSRNWCDHWKQCVWFIPGEGIPVSKGEEVQLHAVHSDISISYDLESKSSGIEVGKYNNNAGDFHLMLSPERIAIYGNNDWRLSMLAAVRNALRGRAPSLCVVADDSVFLTLLVANLSKTSRVISLFPGLRKEGAHYLQAVADANGFSMDRVEVPAKRKANLNIDDTHGMKVDLLIGEPFYYGTDGMLPWQNLRFWKERTMLDPVLSKDALIMPYKGILKGCAMSLPDLWSSRHRLGKIEGFDHSVVNSTLGACDAPIVQEGPCLPYFIWQCGEIKELSQTFTIMEFDFSKPINPCHGKSKVEFTDYGVCHGFALWIDWVMDVESSIVLSTGPGQRYWKQGVKLVGEPVTVGTPEQRNVGACHSALIQASFDPSSGDLIIKHAFS